MPRVGQPRAVLVGIAPVGGELVVVEEAEPGRDVEVAAPRAERLRDATTLPSASATANAVVPVGWHAAPPTRRRRSDRTRRCSRGRRRARLVDSVPGAPADRGASRRAGLRPAPAAHGRVSPRTSSGVSARAGSKQRQRARAVSLLVNGATVTGQSPGSAMRPRDEGTSCHASPWRAAWRRRRGTGAARRMLQQVELRGERRPARDRGRARVDGMPAVGAWRPARARLRSSARGRRASSRCPGRAGRRPSAVPPRPCRTRRRRRRRSARSVHARSGLRSVSPARSGSPVGKKSLREPSYFSEVLALGRERRREPLAHHVARRAPRGSRARAAAAHVSLPLPCCFHARCIAATVPGTLASTGPSSGSGRCAAAPRWRASPPPGRAP